MGESVKFTSMEEAKGYRPLAEGLFNFPFVKGVFIASNFIPVTKNDALSWGLTSLNSVHKFIM